MDTPILPNPTDEVPQAPRAARTIWILRTAAAVVGLVTSVLTLTHNWDFAVRTTLGLKAPTAVWGSPDGSRVCTSEVRPHARGGAWRCDSWLPVNSGQEGRTAEARYGNLCSHRVVVDQAIGVWQCLTRGDMSPVALGYRGGYPQPVFGARIGTRLCIDEWRTTLTQPWTCLEWGVRMPNLYFAEAEPPGITCINERWADQDAGVWSCGQRLSVGPHRIAPPSLGAQ